MAEDFGDRTEDPTEHRRQEAREQGNVARSADLSSAGLLLAVAMVLSIFGDALVRSMAEILRGSLESPAWMETDPNHVSQHLIELTKKSAATVLPMMLLLVVAAVLLNLLQIGFLISTEAIQVNFGRLNPIEGLKRIFSLRGVVKVIVSLGKLAVVVAIAGWAIASILPHFMQLGGSGPISILTGIRQSTVNLALQISGALVFLGGLDLLFQKWKYLQDLRMTKQELREEMKNMEGDPNIRHRRREAHRKLVEARELSQVQYADVVITNPTHIAVALKYDPKEMSAPRVVAKGMGAIAERIRAIAAEHGVPIIERKPVARMLYRDVKVGREIPVEMYDVFVEIMAYVYRLSGKKA